ncbi:hypothetical protein FOA43_001896 [Brettanomyces nanus]|uniref:Phosphatidylinositol 3-kinase VPS34 n=1 Tax=Eeniella nana TaxID=13502 RepID=A0A875S2K0_EENNA|nr:uncharacterized protein FOA43_001896 [Brettanomyces nanus]QPG74565.1 hypothetical protein FOA43_001896 [Brettanomyces nanus]
MTDSDQNLVNFCLSKDLHLPLRIKLVNLTGLTRRLADHIFNDTHDVDEATSRLIRSKLYREQQQSHSLIITVFVESGAGKKIACPIATSLNYSIDNSSKLINGWTMNNKSSNGNHSKWINLPIDYSMLPLDATLVLKFYNFDLQTGRRLYVGQSKLNLFDRDTSCTLVKGFQSVEVKLRHQSADMTPNENHSLLEDKLKAKENSNQSENIDWLDQLTYRKIEQINRVESMKTREQLDDFSLKNGPVFVNLELVRFEMPIVFSDAKYAPLKIPTKQEIGGISDIASENLTDFNQVTYNNQKEFLEKPSTLIFDPDLYRAEISEDPIEYKFRKLERTHQISPLDKDIKPTLKVRTKLDRILKKQFFEKLDQKEKNLIWKFRFFLLNSLVVNGNNEQYNNFIINFIKCIDWADEFEVNEFLTILKDLDTKSGGSNLFIRELTIVDCLELLSENYKNKIVRRMAIRKLEMATDEELEMFMVQLVRAIQNEPDVKTIDIGEHGDSNFDDEVDEFENRSESGSTSSDYQVIDSSPEEMEDPIVKYLYSDKIFQPTAKVPQFSSALSDFIIKRALANPSLTNFFYWNLKVQVDEERQKNRIRGNQSLANDVVTMVSNESDTNNLNTQVTRPSKFNQAASGGYAHKLRHIHVYERTLLSLITRLASGKESHKRINILRRQVELVRQLHSISMKIKVDYRREPTPRKVDILKKLLTEKHGKREIGGRTRSGTATSALHAVGLTISSLSGHDEESSGEVINVNGGNNGNNESMLSFQSIPLPLNPEVSVFGTYPESCTVFKSSLSPLKVTFRANTATGQYPVMYKAGDDLRQDQFVIQIIALMNNILQSENLDLKLTPYRILATGPVEGLIQFVPNSSLSSILSNYNNSILAYLQKYNPDPAGPNGVQAEAMDNYVRSCSGYCVITYILGVGDRHLENLLLTRNGFFFHADFGYILGADPKPFPPLMKLPIQVIEGMGGLNDDNYQKFCNYCFITYLTLRRNASIVLNLFQLMINTPIPALQTIDKNNESEKMEIIWKVQEKFMLDLNDEEAVLHFQRLIDDSVNAVYPVMIDRLHSMAQYWRS